jgi:hypothetical protein
MGHSALFRAFRPPGHTAEQDARLRVAIRLRCARLPARPGAQTGVSVRPRSRSSLYWRYRCQKTKATATTARAARTYPA